MISVAYQEGSTWNTPGAKARELFLASMPSSWRVGRTEVDGVWVNFYEIADELVVMELEKRFPPDRKWV